MNPPPDLPNLCTEGERMRLILAALLQSPERGVSEDELASIVNEYSTHLVMRQVWKSVLAGRLGVSWNEEAKEASFHHLSDEEARARREAILKGMPQ